MQSDFILKKSLSMPPPNVDLSHISKESSALPNYVFPDTWHIRWSINQTLVFSSVYTRHDRACLLWGSVTMCIFLVAQFVPISWAHQAIAATVLTIVGIVGMTWLTAYLAVEKRIAFVLYSWVVLMALGAALTDMALIYSWLPVLMNFCTLWLGIAGIGYCITSIGMRSRTFLVSGLLHLGAIALLPWVGSWQPIVTGLIISGGVLFMAEFQWDSEGVCAKVTHLSPNLPRSGLSDFTHR